MFSFLLNIESKREGLLHPLTLDVEWSLVSPASFITWCVRVWPRVEGWVKGRCLGLQRVNNLEIIKHFSLRKWRKVEPPQHIHPCVACRPVPGAVQAVSYEQRHERAGHTAPLSPHLIVTPTQPWQTPRTGRGRLCTSWQTGQSSGRTSARGTGSDPPEVRRPVWRAAAAGVPWYVLFIYTLITRTRQRAVIETLLYSLMLQTQRHSHSSEPP